VLPFPFPDQDVPWLWIYVSICMGKSLDWNAGRFDNTVEEWESSEEKTWSSLMETPAHLYLKKRSRRGGSPALMACPLRRSVVPAACASCWPDSTSPSLERSPSARWCLRPIPRSSSDLSCCWWPSPFSGPVACAAASRLPTARVGPRWAAGARGWWDTAGWPAGRRLK